MRAREYQIAIILLILFLWTGSGVADPLQSKDPVTTLDLRSGPGPAEELHPRWPAAPPLVPRYEPHSPAAEAIGSLFLRIPESRFYEPTLGEPTDPVFTRFETPTAYFNELKEGGGPYPESVYPLDYGVLESPYAVDAASFSTGFFPPKSRRFVDLEYAYAGRFSWKTPVTGFRLGGRFYEYHLSDHPYNLTLDVWPRHFTTLETVSDQDEFRLHTVKKTVATAEQVLGRLTLTAEYTRNRLDYEIPAHPDERPDGQTGEGYYTSAAYDITDWFRFGSSYSIYYLNREDRNGTMLEAQGKQAAKAWLKDWALRTRFDINETMILNLEGHLINGLAGVDTFTDEEWVKFAAEMTIRF